VRWQTELLLTDLKRDSQISAALSSFAVLSDSALKASNNMDNMPALLDETREAVRADVENQRLSAQAFLREERLKTLYALQQERIASIAAMQGERLATTAEFREELRLVLKELRGQEADVMNEFKTLGANAIDGVDTRGRRLINYFFLRALELMLLMLALCSLMVWVLLRRFIEASRSMRAIDRRSL
jgi:hypothetical protein